MRDRPSRGEPSRGDHKGGVIVWAHGDKNPHFFAHDATILQIQKELGEKITIGMVDYMALMREVDSAPKSCLLFLLPAGR